MKIAIVDDHQLIISSIENALKTTGYMEVTGRYTSGAALLEGLQVEVPDVLLLDYHLPDQNGAELSRYITYHFPQIKILALTGFDKPNLATEMLGNGCMGYLLKSTATTEIIVDAIERIYHGYIFLDSTLREKYATAIRYDRPTDSETKPRLTHRELEVLQGIAAELSSQEIADKLCISKRTVDNHRNSIMAKSGAKNTVGLIKYAIELKLV